MGLGSSNRARITGERSGVNSARCKVVAAPKLAQRHDETRFLPDTDRNVPPPGPGLPVVHLPARAVHVSRRNEWAFWFPEKSNATASIVPNRFRDTGRSSLRASALQILQRNLPALRPCRQFVADVRSPGTPRSFLDQRMLGAVLVPEAVLG